MNPDFNQFYLNDNIPGYYSSQHSQQLSQQQSEPRSETTEATSDYNFDTFDINTLQRVQPGGRFDWNDDLLEQAAEYMYNHDRNNGLKRTAHKFNVVKADLQEYYNEYIERINNEDEYSENSFHGVNQNDQNDFIDDNLSIYPSEDEEIINSIP